MAAFQVGNLDGLLPHFGKVEGELKHLDGTVSSIPSPSSILYHGDAVLAVVSHAMLPAIAKYAQD